MMSIKDGHPSALETGGIQDEVMDEDDKTEVKNEVYCVIKIGHSGQDWHLCQGLYCLGIRVVQRL
jgi:hypothetical protein